MSWAAIAVLAAGTYAMKAVGPVALGRRPFPKRVQYLLLLLAVALLAALVALSTVTADGRLAGDLPLIGGVAAAGLAILRRVPLVGVILIAVTTTALLRLAV
jgi:branched-subunit amino acid transport protein